MTTERAPAGMVERVARAIYEGRNGVGCRPWSRIGGGHQAPYRGDARAAIAAMREAAPDVLRAIRDPWGVDDERSQDLAELGYRRGIDAALSPAAGGEER